MNVTASLPFPFPALHLPFWSSAGGGGGGSWWGLLSHLCLCFLHLCLSCFLHFCFLCFLHSCFFEGAGDDSSEPPQAVTGKAAPSARAAATRAIEIRVLNLT